MESTVKSLSHLIVVGPPPRVVFLSEVSQVVIIVEVEVRNQVLRRRKFKITVVLNFPH